MDNCAVRCRAAPLPLQRRGRLRAREAQRDLARAVANPRGSHLHWIGGGCRCRCLQAQKGNTDFTEVAEGV